MYVHKTLVTEDYSEWFTHLCMSAKHWLQKTTVNGLLPHFAGDEAAGQSGNVAESDSSVVSVETCLVCPMCRVQFADKRDLIEHVAEHAKVPRPGRPERANRPFKCHMCWKVIG